MSEKVLIQQCSPTLAGLKTGNMFSCDFETAAEMKKWLREWNKKLSSKGLRFLPLRYRNHRALIYVYRPSRLKNDLEHRQAREILCSRGYSCEAPSLCVTELIRKMKESEEFPHEIGLFLGYPPEDVYGFIENKACGCKRVGFWKVYGDEQKAVSLFAKYQKCTDVYTRKWAGGRSVEQLTVAG